MRPGKVGSEAFLDSRIALLAFISNNIRNDRTGKKLRFWSLEQDNLQRGYAK